MMERDSVDHVVALGDLPTLHGAIAIKPSPALHVILLLKGKVSSVIYKAKYFVDFSDLFVRKFPNLSH